MKPRHLLPSLLAAALLLAAACAPAPDAPDQAAAPDATPAPDATSAPEAMPAPDAASAPDATPAPAPEAAAPPPPTETKGSRLEDLLRPDDTLATLQARIGAANAIGETLPGPEGETFSGWLLFPDQPTRRLSVYLDDSGRHPSMVVAGSEATDWQRADGVRIGLDSNQLAALNGGSFGFMGFDWDYGGVITDWRGGRLAVEGVGGGPVSLCPPGSGPGATSDDYPMGDQEFSSDLPVVVASPPTVCEFGLIVAMPAME